MNTTIIRIGFNPDFAPFGFVEDGTAVGLVIGRIRHAAEAAGVAVSFEQVALPEMSAHLKNGKVEALAAVAQIPDRASDYSHSAPIVDTGGAWFTLKETAWPDDADLRLVAEGRWQVTTPGAGPLVEKVQNDFPTLGLQLCEDYPEALQMVVEAKVDAAALNWQVGTELAEKLYPGRFTPPNSPFYRLPLTLVVPKGDPQSLLPKLDPHFRQAKSLDSQS
jgi:polar amino acid transport system substrate-binding protein